MTAPCDMCGGTGTPCRNYHSGKGLICTRDKDHPGPHVACGAGIYHPLDTWPADHEQESLLDLLEGDPS